ncbi:MAG: DUF4006 family protein [Campylobacterales bacterium]
MFGLNGIGGMLIATALLLSILVFLGVEAHRIQKENATNFYKIENKGEIQMIATGQREKHIVDVK